jgi:hypothetical protein
MLPVHFNEKKSSKGVPKAYYKVAAQSWSNEHKDTARAEPQVGRVEVSREKIGFPSW